MKKILIGIFCGSLLLVGGCSDATTKVENSDKVLITIGDDEITKGDIYTGLVAQGSATPIEKKMYTILIEKEVPITEEIEKEAKANLQTFKDSYGEKWEESYKNEGYETEEAYYKDVLLLNVRVGKLKNIYVKNNFNDLAKRFKPRKAQIIEVKDVEKAKQALEAAKKDGSDFATIATEFGDTTTYNGAEAVYNSNSGLADALWSNIVGVKKNGTVIDKVLQDTTSGSYYIIKVTNVKPSDFKEEAIISMKDINVDTTALDENGNTELSIADQAFRYFLEKYDYSIHDIDVYQSLLTSSKKYER